MHIPIATRFARLLYTSLCLALPQLVLGVGVSISPSVTSNTYPGGRFTVQVTGVNTGDTISVKHYLDVNGNGIIDDGDMLMEAYGVTDGVMSMIGGATNLNVPGDLNSTNGIITTFIPYDMTRPQMGIGQHLIKVSSPATNFTAITNTIVITNWPFPQSISGTVTCASSNVPNAAIVVLDNSDPNGKNGLVAEVLADATGAYNVKLPAGSYMLLSFKAGYVYSMATAPQVTLTNGASLTNNLVLIPATQTCSGAIMDSVSSNGIPGVFAIFQSAGGLISIASSDKSGTITFPTTPDVWSPEIDNTTVAPIGYITPQKNFLLFDTTTNAVTNLVISLPHGTAMVYGTIRDGSNNPLSGITFYGNDSASTLESYGLSDSNGNYCVVTTATNWWVNPDNNALATNDIVGGENEASLTNGQAIRQDLVVVQATAYFHGTVRDNKGQPVVGVSMWSGTTYNGVNFNSNAQTDTNGNYSLAAFNATWNVGISCIGNINLSDLGLQCPSGNTQLTLPGSTLVNFTLYPLGTSKLSAPYVTHPGQAAITIYGDTGTNYVVQYTTNVANTNAWQTLGTIMLTNPVGVIWDNNATNKSRSYRAKIWP